MWLATGEQMREIDGLAIEEYGVPGLLLMEAASAFTAQIAAQLAQGAIVVVAGSGNNGGDGWGAARHLASRGFYVKVISAVDPQVLRGDAAHQFKIYQNYRLCWELYTGEEQFEGCGLVVDALLGTGVQGAVRGLARDIIAVINRCGAPVLAVDIPSGLPAEAIRPEGEVVQATATVSFGLAKAGLYTAEGRQAAGKIYIDPIGLPAPLLTATGLRLNDEINAGRGIPIRVANSHKGSYGHGLLVAGSRGMSGAAMLAGSSALRSGIGLLTVACPEEINPVLEANLWEAMTLPLPAGQGVFAPGAGKGLDRLNKFSATAIGPGLGAGPGVQELVSLLFESDLPLVIDADGLNALAPGIPRRDAPLIVTPHPGEMARLLDQSIEEVTRNPLDTVRRTAAQWNCIVILKGTSTYIAKPNGNAVVNITGTNGLATGGSGDLLTGLLLGLLAQKIDPFAAACTATWLLGMASELAAEELGTASQLPRDVLNYLAKAMIQLSAFST